MTLFDTDLPTPSRPSVGRHHSNPKPTELKGAIAAAPKSGTRRMQVLEALVSAGQRGLTRHEIVQVTGIPLSSVCGRVDELIGKGAWARETGKERMGPYGTPNAVVYATERGEKFVRSARG